MNFLAHACLAGPGPDDQLGAILGDFVKGGLPGILPAAVAAGVELHRRIDSFADRHPAFCASRARLAPGRRRYAGIIVDMFYDHFLARYWEDYSSRPFGQFRDELYALWRQRASGISRRLDAILPRLQAEDWLGSYRHPDAIATALDRMALRVTRGGEQLAGAGVELVARYEEFSQDFRSFFPAAQAYACALRAARRSRNGGNGADQWPVPANSPQIPNLPVCDWR